MQLKLIKQYKELMNQRVDSLKDEKIDKAVGNLIKKERKNVKFIQ